MAYYSEDNENMAVSKLLSSLLDIRFCDSNTNLAEFIENTSNNNFNAYIDVVPDNKKLNILYEKLLLDLYDDKIRNINLIPIPCIEYFVILALKNMNADFMFKYPWIEVVLYCVLNKQTIIKNYPPRTIGYKGSFHSFEKQCKLVLENCSDIYLNFDTVISANKDILLKSSWYLNDIYGINKLDRASAIAREMPVVQFIDFVPEGFKPVRDMKKKTFDLQSDYSDWYTNFKPIKFDVGWWDDSNVKSLLSKLKGDD